MEPTADERRKPPQLASIVLGVVLLLLLYVLSSGPAWWLYGHDRLDYETHKSAYFPLWWLDDHFDAAHWAFHWYLSLWYVPRDPFVNPQLGY